jgi:hypothetical protein
MSRSRTGAKTGSTCANTVNIERGTQKKIPNIKKSDLTEGNSLNRKEIVDISIR